MSLRHKKEFFELYRAERFEDQLDYYERTREEFISAKTEAAIGSITMIFLAGAVGIAASYATVPGWRLLFVVLAAIFPMVSTILAAYSALYAFEQQAKLFQDTINNLRRAHTLAPDLVQNLTEQEFAQQLEDYVREIEKTVQKEQGQWGQLAEHMKPPET
jgi:ABC-type multidrug transport system fused ATPase/permease subunit